MRAVVLAGLVVLCLTAGVFADDHSVIVDDDVDFSTFRTFAVRDANLNLRQPPLNSPVLVKMLNDAVRQALRRKGLTEIADRPDVTVETSVKGVDFEMQQMGRLTQMDGDGRGRGGRREPRRDPPDFTEATLVIDVKRADTGALVFRGVYHDSETEPSRLTDLLPKDAATLLSKYPVKKR